MTPAGTFGGRLLLALGAAGALTLSCGGGGSPSGVLHTAQLSCSGGSPAATDAVGMTCGAPMDASTERVDAVLDGPSSGTVTVRGFDFDVTYDPAKLEFVPAANDASPIFPNALVAVTLFNGQQGRVLVSIQQPGGLPAVSVGAGRQTIISLAFRRVPGATFGPTPLAFENVDASSASSAITFSAGVTLSYQ